MQTIPGIPASAERFATFEPQEILYEFDGPRIFTLVDSEGELNLACWSDEDDRDTRYIVVPTSARILNALRGGALSVRAALDQPRCWICDVPHVGGPVLCTRVDYESLPDESLPVPGTLLWPHLAPVTETATQA